MKIKKTKLNLPGTSLGSLWAVLLVEWPPGLLQEQNCFMWGSQRTELLSLVFPRNRITFPGLPHEQNCFPWASPRTQLGPRLPGWPDGWLAASQRITKNHQKPPRTSKTSKNFRKLLFHSPPPPPCRLTLKVIYKG